MNPPRTNPIDRALSFIAPGAAANRAKARLNALRYERAAEVLTRHYQAASVGRRTAGWVAPNSSAISSTYGFLERLRSRARDLNRNNGWMSSAQNAVSTATIGSGIVLNILGEGEKVDAAKKLWEQWAETTAIDADGQFDFYGLQRLVVDTITESGSCIIRHRPRLEKDGLPLPLQVQVLEPDFLDHFKDTLGGFSTSEGRTMGGIKFDPLDKRVGYWMFKAHPGDIFGSLSRESTLIPAERVAHAYWKKRSGQIDGVPWAAPCMIRARDFDEYEDAQLLRQKIAACFAAFEHDMEPTDDLGNAPEVPIGEDSAAARLRMGEEIVPGTIAKLGAGRDVTFAQPPPLSGYREYCVQQIRLFAATFGVTYEAVSGDYSQVNYSSSRQAWLQMRGNVEKWRWNMVVPMFLDRVWAWFVEIAGILGHDFSGLKHTWTPPRYWMINPKEEVPALRDAVRNGLQTPSGAVRELGLDPKAHFEEFAEDLAELDRLGLVLDCDPRPHAFSAPGLAQPKSAKPAKNAAAANADAADGGASDSADA